MTREELIKFRARARRMLEESADFVAFCDDILTVGEGTEGGKSARVLRLVDPGEDGKGGDDEGV